MIVSTKFIDNTKKKHVQLSMADSLPSSASSPYKVFSGGRPEKVFSGGMGTAKVFSSGGVALCMSGSSSEPTPGLYKPSGAGVYLLDALPKACAPKHYA